ncbi:hypothetical protein Tco_0212292 [Tanacetum coccineum]
MISWFKIKCVQCTGAQANGQILHEEELAFLADPDDCDEINTAKRCSVHGRILSHYGSDALAEVNNHDNVNNKMINQAVQAMPSFEQSNVVNHSETEITRDRNIIHYSHNFETRFVPQTELSVEQAFWSQNSVNSLDPTPSSRPTKVEVPKELPKVSMVNTSLKKLKHYLASFDVVVKERTTTTAITEGSWGFEHTKACFRDEIIPFVEALKDLFNTFDQFLIDELSEVQNVFHQMEQAVEQHCLESKTFEVKMNQVLNENERLLEQVINKDIVNTIMNYSVDNASVNVHECEKCLKLETELLIKKDFIEKEIYDKLFISFTTFEKHCISLEVDSQLNQEIFQRDNSVSNQSAPSFDQYFEFNELKAQSQEKNMVIKKLKERIKSLSGKMNEDKIKKDLKEIETINIELDHRVSKLIAKNEHLKQTYKQLYDSIKPTRKALVDDVVTKHTIDPETLKIDVEPITPKLLNKKTAHSAYIKHTQEEAAVLRDLVEHVKSNYPLDHSLESACSVDHPAPEVIAPIAEVVALEPAASTEDNHDLDVVHRNNDPFFGIPNLENHSEASSSSDVIPTVVHTAAPIPLDHVKLDEIKGGIPEIQGSLGCSWLSSRRGINLRTLPSCG